MSPECVLVLKVTQLSTSHAKEIAGSILRVPLASPVLKSTMNAAEMRQVLEHAKVLEPAEKVSFFYKDDEGDLVRQTNLEVAWPSECISDGVLKAYFMRGQDAPTTTCSTPVCACPGPHAHLPPQSKLSKLDKAGFAGYSLLAAASNGCALCVEHWLALGVDANFRSSTSQYTAVDCALWEIEKAEKTAASAKQVKAVLEVAGGRANKM